jgi:AcrR family transcriptional regulator
MHPLARRAIPAQARSTVTVEKILSAATSVLAERGLQGLNTNAVAARASINVATLYHYFPDKVAILAELFRRDQLRRSEYFVHRIEELPEVDDVGAWTGSLIHSLVDLRRRVPTTAVLRQACRTVPQLLAIEEEENDLLIEHFSKILRRRFRHLSPNRARHAARVLIETGTLLLDRASVDVEHSPGLIRETIAMLSAYFEILGEGH